jgi:hypothetical protein
MRGDTPPEANASVQSASLLVVPLFHVTGCLSTMTLNYATGGKLVLMPVGRFDPEIAMQAIEREQVTAIGGVPTVMWRILESPNLDKYDLSSVKRASYGGAPAAPELVERIELTMANFEKLDRFRGHLLNWYDTKSLTPLTPQYVSTVDSGNLAGHLLALKQALVEVAEQPVFDARAIHGMRDTISLMREEAAKIGPVRQSTGAVTLKQLRGEIESCIETLSVEPPETLSAWLGLFQVLSKRAAEIEDIVNALVHEHGSAQFEQLNSWTRALMHQLREHHRDLVMLTPWTLALTCSRGRPP